ncbi:MAG TPA: 30S ribosomal protein S17 [Phycisphaerae bacterium]|nr:30S ribosomal protein S17 [Phycisphaerae bacterium]
MTRPRSNRQRLRGIVIRDKAARTVTVQVTRRFRHPRYGKMVRRNTRIAVHDETNEACVGDTVEIVSCRPVSRTKRWRLVGVVERGPGGQLVTGVEDAVVPEAPAPETPAAEAPVAQVPADEAPEAAPPAEEMSADEAPPEEGPAPEPSDEGAEDAQKAPTP